MSLVKRMTILSVVGSLVIHFPTQQAAACDCPDKSVFCEYLVVICDLYASFTQIASAVCSIHKWRQRSFVNGYDSINRMCIRQTVKCSELLTSVHWLPVSLSGKMTMTRPFSCQIIFPDDS